MKIVDSNLMLDAGHQSASKRVQKASLHLWQDGAEDVRLEVQEAGLGQLRQRADALLSHPPVTTVPAHKSPRGERVQQVDAPAEATLDKQQHLEISLLKLLVERISGHEIDLTVAETMRDREVESDPVASADLPQTAPTREGWGMVYRQSESYAESEQTRFQAQGLVRTADGAEISIEIELNMSRSFFTESVTSIRAGDALKDPLVINFSGSAAELTRDRYTFDIDADGSADQIHFLTSDSGFLALDRNGDGRINDGSELFGALSGDGFADLAKLDADGNGWIDAGDPVFDRLRVWSRDEAGGEQLVALGARGVGALYVGHITTPFELKSSDNQLVGAIRQTGLYLSEEGEARSLQQIDLVV
jgi:hypothetical protein